MIKDCADEDPVDFNDVENTLTMMVSMMMMMVMMKMVKVSFCSVGLC